MLKNIDSTIKNYLSDSPNFKEVNWKELPDSTKLSIKKFPKEIKQLGNFVTIRRLKQVKEDMTSNIIKVKKEMAGNKSFNINFPINLKNKYYARLYSLMISEGSYNTEFSLHVPEIFFHELFKDCIKMLISKECSTQIKQDYNKGLLRSRAPAILRNIMPLPNHIPKIILRDAKLSKEYLKVAFEAEGSLIVDMKQHKRYIKLSRYTDITSFINKENFSLEKRIYSGTLNKQYPNFLKKIKKYPPKILKGEQVLLKKQFNIDSKLVLEAIRNNKTDLRAGKITARWVLLIYANNIDKFIKEIGFISDTKNKKIKEMKKIKGNNPQYSTLNLIKNITDKEGFFYRKRFIEEMKNLNYKSPSCYLWRYTKKGLIKRIKQGYYKISF